MTTGTAKDIIYTASLLMTQQTIWNERL